MPTSHFTMDCKVLSWTPLASLPTKWAAEALVVRGDDFAVQKLVHLLLVRPLRGGLHPGVEAEGTVAELPHDVAHVARNIPLSGREGVAASNKDLHQVLREVAAGQVEAQDGVRQGVALVDGAP